MASVPVRYYGAVPDSHDPRDYKKRFMEAEVPLSGGEKDLREFVPFVYSQGRLGSCTANAVCAAYGMSLKMEGLKYFEPSRLFVYYNTRTLTCTVCEDSGASLRNTIKAIRNNGICREKPPCPCWPYDDNTSKTPPYYTQKPLQECYDAAMGNTISKYERLEDHTDIHQIRACLDQNYPLVFLFQVFNPSFDKAGLRGAMDMPGLCDKHEGNHAVVAVGYDDARKTVTILNSWGTHWVDNGYFYMPYDFMRNPQYCYDFWKIEVAIEGTPQARQGSRKATRSSSIPPRPSDTLFCTRQDTGGTRMQPKQKSRLCMIM